MPIIYSLQAAQGKAGFPKGTLIRWLGYFMLLFLVLLTPCVAEDLIQHIAGWDVICRTDRMTDKRSCTAIKSDLTVGHIHDGFTYVTIGRKEERYPGSSVYLRLDSDPLLSTDRAGWSGSDARGIVTLMLRAQRALTRYTSWPSDHYVTQEISLIGFKEVWNYMQTAVKK